MENRTAGELIAELESNSDYLARKAKIEKERDQYERWYREQEKPIIDALKESGIDVQFVMDLYRNKNIQHEIAIPILFSHLEMSYPEPIRDELARALGIKNVPGLFDRLRESFLKEKSENVKDALADSLAYTATRRDIPSVVELLRNPSNGSSRIFLLRVLRRSRQPECKKILEELKSDPELEREISAYEK